MAISRRTLRIALVALSLTAAPALALADDPPAAAPPEAPPPTAAPVAAKPAPPPYSLPWQLRPVLAANVLRIEDSLAFYHDAAGHDAQTNVTMVLGSAKVWRNLVVLARVGAVEAWPPNAASGASFLNPVVGAFYGFVLPHGFRIAPFLAVTIPVGTGGGNTPDPTIKAANAAGLVARSSMDNAMFAVNDLTLFPGLGVAWVGHGVTVQVEATLLQLMRVRGEKVQPDEQKTNFTTGLHVGWFFLPARFWDQKGATMSIGAELRYQRWFAPPKAISSDPNGGPKYDNLTVAAGVRGHFKAGHVILRPGLSYSRGLDDPMAAQGYHIVQLDLPIFFQ